MSPLGVSRQLAINCTHSLIFHFCIDTEGEGTVLDKEKHEEIIPSSQPFFSLSLSLSQRRFQHLVRCSRAIT